MAYPRPINVVSLVPEEALKELQELSPCRSYERGEILFQEDAPIKGIYLVKTGLLKTSVLLPNGHPIVSRIVGPGNSAGFGEYMTKKKRHTSTGEMIQDGQVQMIPTRILETWLQRWPDTFRGIGSMIAHEYYALLDYHINSLIGNVSGRIAWLLQQWCIAGGGKGLFEIPFTHQEMASMLGTTRETIGRTLDRLERENIIRRDKQTIQVVNTAKLAKLSLR